MGQCIYCLRSITNKGSLISHQLVCRSNPSRIVHRRSPRAGLKKGCVPWNRGVRTGPRRRFKYRKPRDYSLTEREIERRRKISISMRGRIRGVTIGAGRGKKGTYKGIHCDSSYELVYVVYCLDHDTPIRRYEGFRWYTYRGRRLRYYPDFIVDSRVLEIKGFTTPQWEAKHACNPDIVVLFREDMSEMFNYVVGKYGKDFTSLYD